MLAAELLDAGYVVRMHDPKALSSTSEMLAGRGAYCDDPYETVSDAAVVVVLTNWPEYDRLAIEKLEERAGPSPLLVDCWRIYKDASFKKFAYRALGTGRQLSKGFGHDGRPDILYQDHKRRASVLERATV